MSAFTASTDGLALPELTLPLPLRFALVGRAGGGGAEDDERVGGKCSGGGLPGERCDTVRPVASPMNVQRKRSFDACLQTPEAGASKRFLDALQTPEARPFRGLLEVPYSSTPVARAAPPLPDLFRTPSPGRGGRGSFRDKGFLREPPSGPHMAQARLRDDIEAAVNQCSLSFLSLTFHRVHACKADHCIHEAVRHYHVSALRFILEHENKVQSVDEHCNGVRALHLALQACAVQGDAGYQMAELLLQHGACPNPCKGDIVSADAPLQGAARRGSCAAVELLIKYGANVNMPDARGSPPLTVACFQAQMLSSSLQQAVVQTLLRHGACPFQRDAAGLPPLRYTTSEHLRGILAKAEQSWHRRSLVALAHVPGLDEGASSGLLGCIAIPGMASIVIGFL